MSCWMSSSRVQTTLTGPSTCLAISTARMAPSDFETPAKSAADEMVMHDDLVERQSGDLRRRGLRACDGLGADPDFAIVLAHVDSAIHRLHRGVRQERHLVGRLDLRCGACHGFVGIADVLRNRAWIARRGFELARDVFRGELRMRAVVPFDLERRESLLGRPHVIGDNRDGIVETHDLTHAFHVLRRAVIDAFQATAEDRRLRKRRDLHAGRPNVDADRQPFR